MGMILTRRYNIDRFGYLIPHHYGNLPMVGAVATYHPGEGRFGGAVAVEEGTTNLYNNPFFQNGMVGWAWFGWSGGGKVYVEAMETPVGNSATIMDNAGATAELALIQRVPLPDVVSNYTVSLLVKNLYSQPCTVQLYMGRSYYTIGTVNPGDGWVRLTRTYVAGEYTQSAEHHFKINTDKKIAIAAIQLEQKPFATSFVAGTRAAGALKYQAAVLAGESYTVSLWAKANTNDPSTWQVLFDGRSITGNGSSQSLLEFNTSGVLMVYYQDGAGTNTPQSTGYVLADRTGWHHYALVFEGPRSGGVFRVYVDGVQVYSFSASLYAPSSDPKLSIGLGAPGNYWNGLIDELLILPYAASEEEIVSWYEAQGPLPPHPQASLQWDRRAVRPAQMVKL